MARPLKMTPEKTERARKMLEAGVPRKEVCEAVGCDYHQLRRACGAAWTQKRESKETIQ